MSPVAAPVKRDDDDVGLGPHGADQLRNVRGPVSRVTKSLLALLV